MDVWWMEDLATIPRFSRVALITPPPDRDVLAWFTGEQASAAYFV
jgi:hypothetical protein